jgi:hypothetical protein
MVLFLTRRKVPHEEGSKFHARRGRPAFVDPGQCLSARLAARQHCPAAIAGILTLPECGPRIKT